MLLRYGRVYPNKSCWTRAHRLWLADERWPYPAQELAWCDHLAAVDGLVARRAAIDEQLSLLMHADYLWPTVARLRCLRGLDSLTALALHVEVGDWARFARPARRLLVESAWHYARAPRLGVTLDRRQEGQPAHILQIAWRAQCRLHRLSQRLRGAGKPANVVTVAVARELACFLWAAAVAS